MFFFFNAKKEEERCFTMQTPGVEPGSYDSGREHSLILIDCTIEAPAAKFRFFFKVKYCKSKFMYYKVTQTTK